MGPARGGSGGGRGHRGRGSSRRNRLAGELGGVLARLPETQREVVEHRVGLADGHPHTRADTARALGLSLGEVREIEQRAFDHIREVVPLDELSRLLPDPAEGGQPDPPAGDPSADT